MVKKKIAYAKTITIKGSDVGKYLKLRKLGYKTMWSGEGKIEMYKIIRRKK